MEQEGKELLLKDLCARFPYGVIVNVNSEDFKLISVNDYRLLANPLSLKEKTGFSVQVKYNPKVFYLEDVRPYLRPMSSMTKEEYKEMQMVLGRGEYAVLMNKTTGLKLWLESVDTDPDIWFDSLVDVQDWLNSHHFDYRNLIEKGLALEAPEGMYK